VDVVEALAQMGGTAESATLRRLTSRRKQRAAIAEGRVLRPRPCLLVLPTLEADRMAALRIGGVRSHLSAALHHGWPVKTAPPGPMVTVRGNARVAPEQRASVTLFWRPLNHAEVADGVTDPVRTVIDCARDLPFDEALAVGDSALRSGKVDPDTLRQAAARSPRTGRARAVRVAEAADGRAANPFESVLGGVALDVPGLSVEPRVTLGAEDTDGMLVIGRVDLVDVAAGIVIEAESWEFHGSKEAFARDLRRYTAMVRAGWRVVRFGWDDVMNDQDRVQAVLRDVLALTRGTPPSRLVRRHAG
jgi:hypothetical protein